LDVALRRLPLVPLVLATALALLVALGAVAWLNDGTSPAGDGEGDGSYQLSPAGELPTSVADVTLASLDGGPDRTLGELLGRRPVVLNFFAQWCQPCITEMPAFERVHRDLGDQVTIVGLAYKDTDEGARATVARTAVTYPTFGDSGQDALGWFGGIQMPTTVFIDADGTVRDVRSRALDEGTLRAALDDLFGIAA
jgi:thiol-disulfide isomerase/thioredoxin